MNRLIRSVAIVYQYYALSISTASAESLRHDITRLQTTVAGKLYLKYARWVQINDSARGTYNTREGGLKQLRISTIEYEVKNPSFARLDSAFEKAPPYEVAARMWMPLVKVLGTFQHLTDIYYNHAGRLPPGLVNAICNHHPSAKLHLNRFRFRSLHDDCTDPEEHALVTSTCLTSLNIVYTEYVMNGREDYNYDAALIAVQSAPNLKHVHLHKAEIYASRVGRPRNQDVEKEGWRGFQPPIGQTKMRSISSLAFSGSNSNRSEMAKWLHCIDFSSLRSLRFVASQPESLWMLSTASRLPSLTDLRVTVQETTSYRELVDSALDAFLSDLPPLKNLIVHGSIRERVLHTICERHGGTIVGMGLRILVHRKEDMTDDPQWLDSQHFGTLAENFHRLSTLFAQVRRTRSNASEARIYKELGRIRSLRTLTLELNCEDPRNPGPPLDGWDDFNRKKIPSLNMNDQVYFGHFEDKIINSAIDEDLALSIWKIITRRNTYLHSLELLPVGGHTFGYDTTTDLHEVIDHIARHYMITRREGAQTDAPEIIEVSKSAREARDRAVQRRAELKGQMRGLNKSNGPAYQVFYRIWPEARSDGIHWTSAWRSKSLDYIELKDNNQYPE